MEKTTHRVYACKILRPQLLKAEDSGVIGRLKNEIACLSYLAGHPNIIRLVDVYETKHTVYMVQEMCQGGNLMQLLEQNQPLSEEDAAHMFRGMIKSVLHCHQMGVIHRDVKPDNFLLSKRFLLTQPSDTVLKLADFGLSCFHRNEMVTEVVGSPYYMAPEMIKQRAYGVQADIWSCGICLYLMLSGSYPFDGTSMEDVFSLLRRSAPFVDFSKPAWKHVTEDCKDLICAMLTADPLVRIQGQDVLTHPWMITHQELKAVKRRASDNQTAPEAPFDTTNMTGNNNNKVIGQTASARVFFSPVNLDVRTKIHTFIDMFKKTVEEPYVRLMQATSADGAAAEWDLLCAGLAQMDGYLERYASNDGFFFLGREPSLAEAAITPLLYRMCATLPVIRNLELVTACEELGLTRLLMWLKEVLDRPSDCCDVRALPQNVYVHLARRLYVKYEGPPTPPSPQLSRIDLSQI